jgi:RNA polymerase sigma-70 factor, ECF subfamily
MVALTDEELILSCRTVPLETARRLIGELARRHLERLAGFICGMTGDASGSLDLAQEAFVRVYKHRENYKEIARFSTWLYTIGRNLALNEIRNRKKRPRSAHGGGNPNASGERDALLSVPADGETPADAAQRGDLRVIVRREINLLPDNYRAVVVLCDLEERSYAEAAEILGVPVGTIRSRLSRAREQLEVRLRRVLS